MCISNYPTRVSGFHPPSQTILGSAHLRQFPLLHHFFRTQHYSFCAEKLESLLKSQDDTLPDYYKASYMLLLAICKPDDEHARIWIVKAMITFRLVATNDSWTAKSQVLLETLGFISTLVNVHLGGSEQQREEPTKMGAKNRGRLRAMGTRDLGLEAILEHRELVRELRQPVDVEQKLDKHNRDGELQAKENFRENKSKEECEDRISDRQVSR
ncbi:hypothetical protein IFR05_005703 [Cadophora sp. M221]|nr:hypothetical protein IFR05_005703 [Cadophora sp. M221]